MLRPSIVILFVWLHSLNPIYAIPSELPETGTPFITNYTPSIYNAHGQNWAIIEDNNGYMYFGNTDGCVLQYDGVHWRQIPIMNGSIVRSLARDANGTIYVGAQNEIGFLAPDSCGSLLFQSILDDIPDEFREFGDVWQIHFIQNLLYLSTRKYLFRRNNDGTYKIWQAKNVFHASFNPRLNQLYIHQRKTGLMVLEGDSLKLIPGGERFKNDWVYSITPLQKKKILIASRNSGLYIFDGRKLIDFDTPAENWLIDNHVYHGTYLKGDLMVFGTQRGGLIFLHRKGDVIKVLNKESGLQDDQIWYVYQDRSNILWVALNKGISKIEYASPWSSFQEANGLEGNVHDIIRHQESLYAATGMGVYRLSGSGREEGKRSFHILEGLKSQCWALLSFGDRLLVSCNHGIFTYQNGQFEKISNKSAWQFHVSKQDPKRIYLGLDQGVSSLFYGQNEWIEEERIPNFNANARTLAEDSLGRLWVGTVYEGVYQIAFSEGTRDVIEINHFSEADGLPGPNYNLVFPLMDGVVFGTIQGVYKFNDGQEVFVPLPIMNAYPQSNASYSILSSDAYGNIWFNSGHQLIQLKKKTDITYVAGFKPFLRLSDFKMYKIYPETGGSIWLGGTEGIRCYDPSNEDNDEQELACHIRRVLSFGDSIIFNGADRQKNTVTPVLPFTSDAMRFEFAAPYFIQEDQNQYRFYLKGFDSEWSLWTSETKKDYTNIPAGTYTFMVMAKNIYGKISSPAEFPFQIQAPLYRRWWAYLIYTVLTALLLSLVLKRLLTYTRTKAILEQQKIDETKRRIEEALRSQVAADFHDELGTQITRISLFSEILKNELVDISDQAKTYLQKIRQNADDLYCETRDFIWQLDPKSDTLMDFISRIKSFANDLLDGTTINFVLKNEIPNSEGIKLPMDMRRNLIRIFKEALHNAFKYANCENIVFELTKNNSGFDFQLSDDGSGFDTTIATEGNGLGNMKNRAEKIDGILHITSQPQKGTQIKLSVKV